MSRRRFFAPPEDFRRDNRVTLAAEEAQHMRGVLRLKPEDEVFVFDGEGREYRCRVTEAGRGQTLLEVCEEVEASRPASPLRLTLCVALLKGEKFDLVVQKATELGVARLVPVITKFADVRVKDEADAARRLARWKRITLEAAKQSGRARVLRIEAPTEFEKFLEVSKGDEGVMFSEKDGESFEVVAGEKLSEITAIVGSEGGWDDSEIEAARRKGFRIVTLGGRILRAETAAIVVSAILQNNFGDLS